MYSQALAYTNRYCLIFSVMAHPIEQAEDMVLVHQVCNQLHWGPGGRLVEALTQGGKGYLVHGVDLPDVALPEP
jgi:hypothetical protein